MSSHQTVRYNSSRGVDLSAQCDVIEKATTKQQQNCAIALRAGVEPVVQLPETIELFTLQGRSAEIPRLEQMVKSIATDYDQFIKEKLAIDNRLEQVKSERPTKKGDLARYSNKINFLGHDYLALTDRIRQVLIPTISDYMDFAHPSDKVEAAS